MIIEKLAITYLTQESVSILKQRFYVEEDGTETQLGDNHRTAYTNNEIGRNDILELPENIVNSILAMWGEVPNIVDSTEV